VVNLCVTVTNRVDLLPGMLRSAFAGTVVPDYVYLVDQKGDRERLFPALDVIDAACRGWQVVDLGAQRGSEAAAINWYLQNVPEERVIAHEDVVFGPLSLETFVAAEGAFLIDSTMGVMTYRDRCLREVGTYDEEMSPNFFLYADVDYEDRLAEVGIHPAVVFCGCQHLVNGTLKGTTELEEFHRRALIAQRNYETKWGRPVTLGGNTIGRGLHRQRSK